MKGKIKTLRFWINERIAACKKSAAERRARAIARESERAVQLREFNGSVYICLNDIPVIKGEHVSGDIVNAVKSVREAWMLWKEREVSHGAGNN